MTLSSKVGIMFRQWGSIEHIVSMTLSSKVEIMFRQWGSSTTQDLFFILNGKDLFFIKWPGLVL
jgi:protein gp37